MAEQVTLGKRYRDTISGFEGVATARYEFLYGCVRYNLEGEHLDGKAQDMTVDEQRLVCVDSEEPVASSAPIGGPREIGDVRHRGPR